MYTQMYTQQMLPQEPQPAPYTHKNYPTNQNPQYNRIWLLAVVVVALATQVGSACAELIILLIVLYAISRE